MTHYITMHILFLSHYFPPEVNAPASRGYEHCKQWVKAGHRVTVVSCAPNHPRGVVYDGYRNRLFQRETRDGVEVVRVWTYVTANEGFLKRTLNYVSFMVSAILVAVFLDCPDVLLTTSPQFFNGLAGYPVSRLKRVPWALEIRDLWPESILTVGAIRNKTIIRLLEWLEMFAYRKANRIVALTDAFKHYMVGKGIPAEKIDVIKNGVDLSFFKSDVAVTEAKQRFGVEKKFVASYVGTHGMAHHLETILEAADQLRHRTDIVFLMAGDGAERKRLETMREQMGLGNVIMLGQLPKDTMPALWAATDVSLVLLKKSPLFKMVIPSKIFESMAMEKPIVIGVDGEAREIVEAGCAGLFIEPEDSAALAETVARLADNRYECRSFGTNGRAYVAQNFDRTVLAKRYEEVLRKMSWPATAMHAKNSQE